MVVALRCVARGGGSEVRDVAGSVQLRRRRDRAVLALPFAAIVGHELAVVHVHYSTLTSPEVWAILVPSLNVATTARQPPRTLKALKDIEKALKAASIDAFSMVSGC